MSLYPQKPPFTQDELVEFLNTSPLARLGTHNPDGTIHLAPVYFKYINGEFLLGTQSESRKIRNIQHNPQVTLLIDNQVPPWKGVLIYGEAVLDYEDVVAKRVAIFERYVKTEDAFRFAQFLKMNFDPVIVHVKPLKIISFDYTKEGWLEKPVATPG
jgi:nitroimidazol reductase NimA-like FMN-containing flavoprotein (pyridoxamine 5'-phosphate oxidase superfamily)